MDCLYTSVSNCLAFLIVSVQEWLMVLDLSAATHGMSKGERFQFEALLPTPDCLVYRSDSMQRIYDGIGDVRRDISPQMLFSKAAKAVDPYFERGWAHYKSKTRAHHNLDTYCESLW